MPPPRIDLAPIRRPSASHFTACARRGSLPSSANSRLVSHHQPRAPTQSQPTLRARPDGDPRTSFSVTHLQTYRASGASLLSPGLGQATANPRAYRPPKFRQPAGSVAPPLKVHAFSLLHQLRCGYNVCEGCRVSPSQYMSYPGSSPRHTASSRPRDSGGHWRRNTDDRCCQGTTRRGIGHLF